MLRVTSKKDPTQWRPWFWKNLSAMAMIGFPLAILSFNMLNDYEAANLTMSDGFPFIGMPTWLTAAALFAMTGLILIGLISPLLFTRGPKPMRHIMSHAAKLDEREKSLRLNAYAKSYQMLAATCLLILFITPSATNNDWWIFPSESTEYTMSGLMAVIWLINLPYQYLIWTMKPLADEEE